MQYFHAVLIDILSVVLPERSSFFRAGTFPFARGYTDAVKDHGVKSYPFLAMLEPEGAEAFSARLIGLVMIFIRSRSFN